MKHPDLLQLAKEALSVEITELENLKTRLGSDFLQAVDLIHSCSGKLIVVGIGKSAHVGNKIVATLNSTGTPAQFLHASEALHGDLGVIQKSDIVLCISNSGNSPEIVNLLPFLKDYSSALIGMTGNRNSKLAETAEVVLDSFVEKEACPIKLAPTSSTTVQMALGDALAVCLMELNGFREHDFARFHPGGSLGKNLTAKVSQFISDQKPQVSKTAGIRDIIISISSSKHGITVVAEDDRIIGVITDGDLRRMLMSDRDLSEICAADIMSAQPKTVDKDDLAKTAMNVMKKYNIGQLVVTANQAYHGIIDIHRLLDEGIN